MRKADNTNTEQSGGNQAKKVLKIVGKIALIALVGIASAALASFLAFASELFGIQTNQDTKALTYCIACLILLVISTALYFIFLIKRRRENKKMPYLATASYVGFAVGAVFMLVMFLIMAADPFVKPGDEYQTGKF